MQEEWRPITGHPNYEVSNLGRVRRIAHRTVYKDGRWQTYKVQSLNILKPSYCGGSEGNRYPALRLNGKFHYIHYLVCVAFHGPRPGPNYEVAHDDSNRQNPVASNLRWDTRVGNFKDKIKNGTLFGRTANLLDVTKVKEIKKLLSEGLSGIEIAQLYNVSPPTISKIKNKLIWIHI